MSDTLYHWTNDSLATLPLKGGVRLRGMEMTRLETFTDAAFAFAVTLLVISVDDVPNSYEEFVEALKKIPAFIMCFIQLMLFWWGHHQWSRRYGLEDGWSMVWSLALVAMVLIFIYPLRAIFATYFAYLTDGALPMPFDLDGSQIGALFVVFGVGFSSMAVLIVVLNLIALQRRVSLAMNQHEIKVTRGTALAWGLVTLTGLISTFLAMVLPEDSKPLSGYVYWSLIVTFPLFRFWFGGRQNVRVDA